MLLLGAFTILLSTNRVLLDDLRALPDDGRKVALVKLELEPVCLQQVVRGHLQLSADASKAVRRLERHLEVGLEGIAADLISPLSIAARRT